MLLAATPYICIYIYTHHYAPQEGRITLANPNTNTGSCPYSSPLESSVGRFTPETVVAQSWGRPRMSGQDLAASGEGRAGEEGGLNMYVRI